MATTAVSENVDGSRDPKKEADSLTVTISIGDFPVTCNVTEHSMRELGLLPGDEVFALFKATSIEWY